MAGSLGRILLYPSVYMPNKPFRQTIVYLVLRDRRCIDILKIQSAPSTDSSSSDINVRLQSACVWVVSIVLGCT